MPYLLSESQLQDHIIALKDTIDAFGRYQLSFINAYSFYDHVSREPSVGGLLDAVAPYLPLRLSVEGLDMFLSAARRGGEAETDAGDTADFFLLKARVDFVDSLQKANTPDQWARLVDACGAIRDIKEQLFALAR